MNSFVFLGLSVADFVLKIVPFLAFVRLKIVPFVLKIVPFLSFVRLKIVPFLFSTYIVEYSLERMKRVRGGTIFYLCCGVLEPKKRVRGGT